MAFEYTPLTAQNQQRQRDQYQAFQTRQAPSATGSASNPTPWVQLKQQSHQFVGGLFKVPERFRFCREVAENCIFTACH